MSVLLKLDPSWVTNKYSRLLLPWQEGGCCRDMGTQQWRERRRKVPNSCVPSNNQGAPLGAGTAPQPLHFIWLRKLPPPFLSSISISLSWAWTIFWDKMHVLLPSALPEAQIAPAAQPSNLGGRNQFQHLSFEHQTCGLAQSCVFTPS